MPVKAHPSGLENAAKGAETFLCPYATLGLLLLKNNKSMIKNFCRTLRSSPERNWYIHERSEFESHGFGVGLGFFRAGMCHLRRRQR